MRITKYNKNLVISIIAGGLISLILFLLFAQILIAGTLKTQLTKSYLAQNIKDKNLSLIDEHIVGTNIWASDLNISEYYKYLKKHFHYSKDEYDCKFYSLNWALYLDKHNYKYTFVSLDKHIFVVAMLDNGGYIILDENNKIDMIKKE